MEDPSLADLEHIAVEDLIRNTDGSGICDKPEFGTERKISSEPGSLVHQSSIVAPLVHILVIVRVYGAAVDGQGGRYRYI